MIIWELYGRKDIKKGQEELIKETGKEIQQNTIRGIDVMEIEILYQWDERER